MRIIDADALDVDFYDTLEDDNGDYIYVNVPFYSKEQIDSAPTIKTKMVKYFDENESVLKIGEVIVDE